MNFRHPIAVTAAVALAAGGILITSHYAGWQSGRRVDFSRDIRPIFNQNCTLCHGGVRQKNGVSFIYREEALGKGKSGRPTIVPGHPESSELMARVTSTDPELRMPYHAPPLPPEQIALLRQWIKEGAQWEDHWAFVAPKPQAVPQVKRTGWPREPLDHFILARLEKEGLEPSPEASKAELLRRVSFDLTGLPPTPEELSGFLADSSADAYEKQVDRLLASPHYGERWASLWLDLARYADTRGFGGNRPSWPYRDWVINAFNKNLPYDRFVITQLAGDLLPNATADDEIATCFQRQTSTNDEAGTDDEEFRTVAVMDRAATTWSVLNGVTMNCVQCHSHPYDPIRHAEYYKFLAFYNTSLDADLSDDSPNLPVAEPARRSEADQLEERKVRLQQEIVGEGRSLTERTVWTPLPIANGVANEVLGLERVVAEMKAADRPPAASSKTLQKGFNTLYHEVFGKLMADLNRAKHPPHLVPLKIDHGEAQATGDTPSQSVFELQTEPAPPVVTALRIEVPPRDPETARHTPEDGFIVDRVDAWIVDPSRHDPAHHEQKIEFRYFAPDSRENLANEKWSMDLPGKEANASIAGVGRFAGYSRLFHTRWMVAIPATPLTLPHGCRLKVQLTHTPALAATFRHVQLAPDKDKRWLELANDQTLTVRFAELAQADAAKLTIVKRVRFDTSADARWTSFAKNPALTEKLTDLADVDRRLSQIPTVPVPVMAEEPAYRERQTLEFERGNFLTKIGPALSPDVPALFPKLPGGAPRNRLTMAKWFFAPGQPLTARVAVNRYWEQLFGTGIVETLEDFGSSGQPPSHPELLDWLALHFQNDLRWDMKALLRELVTSATYRQTGQVTAALLEKDPHNRLLAHGPQQRLTAEMVRDQALTASGLLNPALGGPPVMPPQPASVSSTWKTAAGPDRYRRAIYTYLVRGSIYPTFLTFDGSAHDVSLARRIPTNTPLQALVTLNDAVYYEAAEGLARRMLAFDAGPGTTQALAARLNYGAERVLSRDLSPAELAELEAFYARVRKLPAVPVDKNVAKDMAGLSLPKNKDLAALTAVAGVLFNLDAALTR